MAFLNKKNSNLLVLGFALNTAMAMAASGSAPIAVPDSIDAEIDAIVKINPLSNDSGDGMVISSVTSAKGAIVNIFDDQVMYRFPASLPITPIDSVVYTLIDSAGHSATSTINVHLMKDGTYIDAEPEIKFSINDDDAEATLGEMNVIDVLANDTSPEGGLLITEAASTNGAKVEINDNKINYYAWDDSIKSDKVVYYVHDANGQFGWATVNVEINNGEAKLHAENDNFVAILNNQNPEVEDMSFVLENDEFDSKTGEISSMESRTGSTFKSKQGRWMYVPQQVGEDMITYTLKNSMSGNESTASVKVDILPATLTTSKIKATNDEYSLKISNDGLYPDLDLSQVLKNDTITSTTKISSVTAATGKTYFHNGFPYYHAAHVGLDTLTYYLLDTQTGEVASAVAKINVTQ